MRKMQNRAAGRLVNAAAFHSNKTILDDVHPTDAMFAAKFVYCLQHLEWRKLFSIHTDAISSIKFQLDVFRLIRRVFRGNAQFVHAAHFW